MSEKYDNTAAQIAAINERIAVTDSIIAHQKQVRHDLIALVMRLEIQKSNGGTNE